LNTWQLDEEESALVSQVEREEREKRTKAELLTAEEEVLASMKTSRRSLTRLQLWVG